MLHAQQETRTSDLVRSAQAGCPAAFEALVNHFEAMVRGVTYRITRNADDAQDAAQETWYLVFTKLPQLRDPASFPGWLHTTARREALKIVTAGNRTTWLAPEHLATLADPGLGPDAQAERGETGERVREAMRSLPPDRSQLLTEMIVQERSYVDVSASTGRPIGSLGPLRARYLRQLEMELGLDASFCR